MNRRPVVILNGGEAGRSRPKSGSRRIRRCIQLQVRSQFEKSAQNEPLENRRHPRYKLDVEMRVYPRDCPVVRGHSVDLSESGVAVMLRDELPIGEIVRLEFTVPLGPVEVHALVCQRNAFRYGLQFVEPADSRDIIGRTCRQLAMEQALKTQKAL
jgi:hypothetical protein